jgi:hypothetical protein
MDGFSPGTNLVGLSYLLALLLVIVVLNWGFLRRLKGAVMLRAAALWLGIAVLLALAYRLFAGGGS